MSDSVLAEFATANDMMNTLPRLREARLEHIETFTPFDVPGLPDALRERPSPVGWIALGGGIAGVLLGYGIQWWSDAHAYPLNVGGRPIHAVPAFAVATTETAMLCAAGAAFIGMLLLVRFPRLWAHEDEIENFERASIDRFWIEVDALGSIDEAERASTLLKAGGALRVVKLSSGLFETTSFSGVTKGNHTADR